MMEKDYTQKPWEKMPLAILETPRNGAICYLDSWWSITPDGCALFYRGSPQCNGNEACAESIRKKIHPTCTLKFVKVAYLSHDCHEYVF